MQMETDLLLEREWNAWIERFVANVNNNNVTTSDADVGVVAPTHTVPDETVLANTGLEPPLVFQEESAAGKK